MSEKSVWARVRGCVLVLLCAILAVSFYWRHVRSPQAPPPLPVSKEGPLVGLRFEVAYPLLTFRRPVFMTFAPGAPETAYVVEQIGVIRRFAASPDTKQSEVFLDLRKKVSVRGNEEGLLGLAFHPAFPKDRRLFVYYSSGEGGPMLGGRSVVSSFVVREDGSADPASEALLFDVIQPYRNHNGGMLLFGPDGKLYVGLGDGGLASDPDDNGLRPETLLGSILRVDVDTPGKPYGIPADNPLLGTEGARGEVYAYGFRNPWRFSFDRETGELWTGDVGQNAWEEVHLVERGGNHGWKAYEGFAVYSEDDVPRAQDAVRPLAAYGRGEGLSITGGYVYRGASIPALRGDYVYADYQTGAVWALERDPSQIAQLEGQHPTAAGVKVTKVLDSDLLIASFAEGPDGELYVCAFDGQIHALRAGN